MTHRGTTILCALLCNHATSFSRHSNIHAPQTQIHQKSVKRIPQSHIHQKSVKRNLVRVRAEVDNEPKPKSLRREIYDALSPLDRGDFRWEFLVPWTTKKLTDVDKFIICFAFIGVSFVIQSYLDRGSSVGVHLSYIAQFFSYATGQPIVFRSLAVLTALLETLGLLFEKQNEGILLSGGLVVSKMDTEELFPIFYDSLFIVINLYYIMRWWLNRESAALALDWVNREKALFENCFAPLGFRPNQFARLLKSALFQYSFGSCSKVDDSTNGDILMKQGEPLRDLFVAINGNLEVVVGGVVTTTIPPFQLVGEASLLENLQSEDGSVHPPARATVVAPPSTQYVKWSQESFYKLQAEEDSEFAYVFQLMIARTLSEKLRDARFSQQGTAEEKAQLMTSYDGLMTEI